jgi:hypothetical protein
VSGFPSDGCSHLYASQLGWAVVKQGNMQKDASVNSNAPFLPHCSYSISPSNSADNHVQPKSSNSMKLNAFIFVCVPIGTRNGSSAFGDLKSTASVVERDLSEPLTEFSPCDTGPLCINCMYHRTMHAFFEWHSGGDMQTCDYQLNLTATPSQLTSPMVPTSARPNLSKRPQSPVAHRNSFNFS